MAVEFKHGDYIKGGWAIVKPNLVPSIVAALCCLIPVLGWGIVQVNYMKAVKEAKASGKPIEIGALFGFDNVVNVLVASLIAGVASSICFLLFPLFMFVPCILADHPGVGFMDAIKGSLAFGKSNYVPILIFMIVCIIVYIIGEMCLCVGIFVALPVILSGVWCAYDEHKAAIHAAAAESGVTLA